MNHKFVIHWAFGSLVFLAMGWVHGQSQLLVPSQFATIQGAVNAAFSGDEILVAPGTYYGTIQFGDKRLRVVSSGGPNVTILDGAGQGPIISWVALTYSTTRNHIEGLTIRNGVSTTTIMIDYPCGTVFGVTIPCPSGLDRTAGGAIYGSGAFCDIRNCIFINNSAQTGGAIYFSSTSNDSMIEDCDFIGNTATPYPGVLTSSYSVAFDGGSAIHAFYVVGLSTGPAATASIARCNFDGNYFNGPSASVGGGGCVWVKGGIRAIQGCTFVNNYSSNTNDCCLKVLNSVTSIVNCIVQGNSVGGLRVVNGGEASIRNCRVATNSGHGLYIGIGGGLVVDGCAVIGNSGTGLVVASEIGQSLFGDVSITRSLIESNGSGAVLYRSFGYDMRPVVLFCSFFNYWMIPLTSFFFFDLVRLDLRLTTRLRVGLLYFLL